MRRVYLLVGVVLVAVAVPSSIAATRHTDQPPDTVTVTRVIDGDTVELADGRTIRLLGIDTPEVYGGVECWGREASAYARDTLLDEEVTVVADPSQDRVDRYGRALAYLLLPDGTNYSIAAAHAGAARSYVYDDPVAEHAAIVAAETDARAAGRGLWGACP